MTDAPPRILRFGDSAVLVELGDRIDPAINARVHRLARQMEEQVGPTSGFGRPVPSYGTVLVPVDPLEPGVDAGIRRLTEIVARAGLELPGDGDADPAKLVELPTRYGGEDGPDLEEVAASHGLRPADVVELHASVEYRVYLLGFAPGFAYLGSVPELIRTPRRETPRTRVPAGSVGIANDQTAVYPFDTPGGWQLIGRTDRRMWDEAADPPALLAPGDHVRFAPVR
jgi:inhibitor of KinA